MNVTVEPVDIIFIMDKLAENRKSERLNQLKIFNKKLSDVNLYLFENCVLCVRNEKISF